MATLAERTRAPATDDRFFLTMSIAMALVLVAGFSLQLAAGRSSFGAPPLVHAHAITFFGWVVLYVIQNILVTIKRPDLHRTLGWIGAGWMVVMVILGTAVTLAMVRRGGVPFFFTPSFFLIMDPLSIYSFAGLTTAAIILRKKTEWHRRLHLCGMATLTGPGFGRLLPMPFLIPWAGWAVFAAIMIFPLIGVIADLRRTGGVHRAWVWGIGVMVAVQIAMPLIAHSPLGAAIYKGVTAGSPGAAIDPMVYPPFPNRP
jgi:hypothetical protein